MRRHGISHLHWDAVDRYQPDLIGVQSYQARRFPHGHRLRNFQIPASWRARQELPE
jgi:hypothetical protein